MGEQQQHRKLRSRDVMLIGGPTVLVSLLRPTHKVVYRPYIKLDLAFSIASGNL